jgi:hypothetical protein
VGARELPTNKVCLVKKLKRQMSRYGGRGGKAAFSSGVSPPGKRPSRKQDLTLSSSSISLIPCVCFGGSRFGSHDGRPL